MVTEAQGPKAPKQYDVFKTGQGKYVLVVGVEDGNVSVAQAKHIADFQSMSPQELLAGAVTRYLLRNSCVPTGSTIHAQLMSTWALANRLATAMSSCQLG